MSQRVTKTLHHVEGTNARPKSVKVIALKDSHSSSSARNSILSLLIQISQHKKPPFNFDFISNGHLPQLFKNS